MKKYVTRATKWLAIFTLFCAILLAVGIILVIIGFPNISLQICLIALGGVMGIIFLSVFLAERSRALVIDNEKVIFPRGADKNGKIVLQKTVVNFVDIRSVDSVFHKGDGLISGDCFSYILTLKDSTKISVTLYAYGKDAEKEIFETIRQCMT